MQRKIYSIVIILFILASFTSCVDSENTCTERPDIDEINLDINFEDLTSELIKADDQNKAEAFINEYPFVANYFFNPTNQLSDSAIAALMTDVFSHPSYKDTLYKEVEQTFNSFDQLNRDFTKAFKTYKYYYPDVYAPKIQYVLSGLQKDLFVSDTLICIAADYFLGPDARFVPLGIPQYILKRYQKEYIVPMTMLLVTQEKNQTDPSNKTLLADMIYFGKSYYLAKQTLPCTPDSLLLGYSAKEMTDINKNEHIIWANFLENDLLYESSHFIKNKFTGERPKTFEISNNCPGRIGLWVGWQIIRSYMENNPEVSLQELMKMTDVNLIFSKSGYKPKP